MHGWTFLPPVSKGVYICELLKLCNHSPMVGRVTRNPWTLPPKDQVQGTVNQGQWGAHRVSVKDKKNKGWKGDPNGASPGGFRSQSLTKLAVPLLLDASSAK
eukprot:TRINITY_DN67023_c7_g1_i3.p1 TRINITY_DN67023_c7_g1~~TRINITY_DN67023_c7_g1_i3.p1  ORF type:complete len:102 (+),score=0.56 TRINITY_DN67023_c7_g1_i3:144-449(+)